VVQSWIEKEPVTGGIVFLWTRVERTGSLPIFSLRAHSVRFALFICSFWRVGDRIVCHLFGRDCRVR
jgi:hypothetical protein